VPTALCQQGNRSTVTRVQQLTVYFSCSNLCIKSTNNIITVHNSVNMSVKTTRSSSRTHYFACNLKPKLQGMTPHSRLIVGGATTSATTLTSDSRSAWWYCIGLDQQSCTYASTWMNNHPRPGCNKLS